MAENGAKTLECLMENIHKKHETELCQLQGQCTLEMYISVSIWGFCQASRAARTYCKYRKSIKSRPYEENDIKSRPPGLD